MNADVRAKWFKLLFKTFFLLALSIHTSMTMAQLRYAAQVKSKRNGLELSQRSAHGTVVGMQHTNIYRARAFVYETDSGLKFVQINGVGFYEEFSPLSVSQGGIILGVIKDLQSTYQKTVVLGPTGKLSLLRRDFIGISKPTDITQSVVLSALNDHGQVATFALSPNSMGTANAAITLWDKGSSRIIFQSLNFDAVLSPKIGYLPDNSVALDINGNVLFTARGSGKNGKLSAVLLKSNENYASREISIPGDMAPITMYNGRILLPTYGDSETEVVRTIGLDSSIILEGTGPYDTIWNQVNLMPGSIDLDGDIVGVSTKRQLPFIIGKDNQVKYFHCPGLLDRYSGLEIWSVNSISENGQLIAQGVLSNRSNEGVIVTFTPVHDSGVSADCITSKIPYAF